MKNRIFLIGITILFALSFFSCEFGVEEPGEDVNTIVISGLVVETNTGNPVSNASVKITDGINQEASVTDSNGKFNITFPLTEDKEINIITIVQGYKPDTTEVFASKNGTLELSPIKLIKNESAGINTSGKAASIYLYSQTEISVGVKESGANETVQIIFQLLDSLGNPINSNSAVDVNFIFGSTPAGGEYLYPSSIKSNALGRASVTLNTGIKAGVCQVIAESMVNGKTIRSKPVLVSIHGGFPDPARFGVACEDLNYPAYGIIGYEIPFTAYVGDKYSNPVRPGTSVYFETTSGIVEGSNITDELGRSTVTLLTQPSPDHSTYGKGFFVVTSSTVDENLKSIETETVRLLSGLPQLSVNPLSIDIQNGGAQNFSFTINDQNGNPLAKDNLISVRVLEGQIKLSGDTDIKLPDTQSKFYTQFSFTAYDSKPDSINTSPAVILIHSTGPNGDSKITVSGISR